MITESFIVHCFEDVLGGVRWLAIRQQEMTEIRQVR